MGLMTTPTSRRGWELTRTGVLLLEDLLILPRSSAMAQCGLGAITAQGNWAVRLWAGGAQTCHCRSAAMPTGRPPPAVVGLTPLSIIWVTLWRSKWMAVYGPGATTSTASWASARLPVPIVRRKLVLASGSLSPADPAIRSHSNPTAA